MPILAVNGWTGWESATFASHDLLLLQYLDCNSASTPNICRRLMCRHVQPFCICMSSETAI